MAFLEVPFLGELSIWTVVEVLFLAIVAYAFIRHLQATRGGGLVAGFIVLAIAFAIGVAVAVKTLNMPHIRWLSDQALPAMMVGLVILFQPELRLAISRLGKIRAVRMVERFFGAAKPVQRERVAVVIGKACRRMSKQRIGALIVVQRNEGIEGFASGGTRVDAEISTPLLETLFHPGSPLHDGAAFITSGRLMFAGCHLPLSESEYMNRGLGTRHRAAIGMSEESDALVIVVSEETGRISMARDGTLTRDVTETELRQLIHEGIVTQLEAAEAPAELEVPTELEASVDLADQDEGDLEESGTSTSIEPSAPRDEHGSGPHGVVQ